MLKEEKAQQPTHSPIGASSAYRWMACPGSVQASAVFPDSTSKYAAEGTVAHQVAEYYLKRNKMPNGTLIGETYEVDDFTFKVTEDMETHVSLYVETLFKDLATHGLSYRDLVIEAQVSIPDVHKDARGTADAYFSTLNTLKIYDLKFGHRIVAAKDNPQLKYYALGVYSALDDFFKEELTHVEVNIVQPRVNDPVKRSLFTVEELMDFKKELTKAIALTELPPAKLTYKAGDHCKFCTAKVACETFRKNINNTSRGAFEALISQAAKPVPEMPPINLKEPGELIALYDSLGMIREYLNCVEEYILASAKAGYKFVGYKLVQHTPRSNRAWVDEAMAEKELVAILGNQAWNTKLKSPAQIEKLKPKGVDMELLVYKPIKPPVIVLEKENSDKPNAPLNQSSRDVFENYKEAN